MLSFISNNLGTILVCIAVLGIVTAIIVRMVQNKKKGKMIICNCGCSSCPKEADNGCCDNRRS